MIEAAQTTLLTRGEQLLRLTEVEKKTSLGSTTIYRFIETEGFPEPIRLGPKAVRWRESEIDAWISRQSAKNVRQGTPIRRR